MLRFNTMDKDPYVSIMIDEMGIIDLLTDIKAYDRLKKLEAGVKSPSRPSSLIYVDFFYDTGQKLLFLLLADDKELGLKFPQISENKEQKVGKMVLISATSTKAMLKFFSECAHIDPPQRGIYFKVQHFLNGAFRRFEIPIE